MTESQHSSGAPLWGVSAEFDSEDAVSAALRALSVRRFGRLDAYSPVPIRGAADLAALGSRSLFPLTVLAALLGGGAMFGMCSWATIYGYRFNIGGRPLFSWPAFVVPSVSFGMLTGALTVVALLLVTSRLPRLNHPSFNIPGFTRATDDRFFVSVQSEDDGFDAASVERALGDLDSPPIEIHRVPR